jgi:hypothetical protein
MWGHSVSGYIQVRHARNARAVDKQTSFANLASSYICSEHSELMRSHIAARMAGNGTGSDSAGSSDKPKPESGQPNPGRMVPDEKRRKGFNGLLQWRDDSFLRRTRSGAIIEQIHLDLRSGPGTLRWYWKPGSSILTFSRRGLQSREISI